MNKGFCLTLLNVAGLFLLGFSSWVSASEVAAVVSEAQVVAKYNYIINILTMLLVGFGFLMVFVRRYGFGAVTGTYLVVAVGLPLYILSVSYTHLRAHETVLDLVCRLLLETKKA